MAPAARTAPPPPAGPAPGVFGPRRLTRRLAHTAYTLHTASSHTRQPHGHHELKIFSRPERASSGAARKGPPPGRKLAHADRRPGSRYGRAAPVAPRLG